MEWMKLSKSCVRAAAFHIAKLHLTQMQAKFVQTIEIARELQVSRTLITSDIQYLRSQAKESIKEYVTEHLPEQYQIRLTALDEIIKRAFEILETSDDNREKLQAMELFKDTHLVKLELQSNATTIDSALNYIRNKRNIVNVYSSIDSMTAAATACCNNLI
jgi:hypothetical protein